MTPALTALIDQAEAASGHAVAVMRTLAALEGQQVRDGQAGPIFRAIINRLQRRALSGQLTLCPHLSWTAPAPAFWCAWAPGRLRCPACAHQANLRVRGTTEDRRCDHCRKAGRTIHPDMAQLPPVVVDLPNRPAMCIPPVTVMFGLCPTCQKHDIENRPEEP